MNFLISTGKFLTKNIAHTSLTASTLIGVAIYTCPTFDKLYEELRIRGICENPHIKADVNLIGLGDRYSTTLFRYGHNVDRNEYYVGMFGNWLFLKNIQSNIKE